MNTFTRSEILPGAALMDDQPLLYEQYLLAGLNKSEKLWSAMLPALCMSIDGKTFVNDFNSNDHYVLYRAMRTWREIVAAGGGAFAEVSPNGICTALTILSSQQDMLLDVSEIGKYTELWNRIMSSATEAEAMGVLEKTYRPWLMSKRCKKLLFGIARGGTMDVEDRMQEAIKLKKQMDTMDTGDDGFVAFGDGLDGEGPTLERIRLGKNFRHLNDCLGGGLGKSEHILFIAPTGAGKTVLACQLAGDVASSGHHVLLITTEQPARELHPRIISAFGSDGLVTIPFDTIKDGGEYKKLLSESQYASYMKVRKAIEPTLHYYEWEGRGMSIQADMENVIRKALDRWPVEVVILDWIGASLGRGLDVKERRVAYLDAAELMKDLARAYNIAAISFAQANMNAVDKKKVSEQYIAEAHNLHQQADAAFGISALQTSGTAEGDQASYDETQFCYCFKSRKARGQFFSMKRKFACQRFENM